MIPTRTQWTKWSLPSRLTAIGAYVGVLGIVVSIILFLFQNLVSKNETTLEYEGANFNQQALLAEIKIRNDQLNQVFTQISIDLSNQGNKERNLSDELIGRIAILSKLFKPYDLLNENDNIFLSPERGLLLAVLIRSRLSKKSYDRIYYFSDFSYADLRELNLTYSNTYLVNCNLRNATLENTKLYYADLTDANLSNANLVNANLYKVILKRANLSGVNLTNAQISASSLEKANLSNANMLSSDLREVELREANLSNANLNQALVERADWFSMLPEKSVIGVGTLNRYYVNGKLNEVYPKYVNGSNNNRIGEFYVIEIK